MIRLTRTMLLLAAPLAVFGCSGGQGGASSGGAVTLASDDEKTLYALGLIVGRNLSSFNLTPKELDIVKAGIADQVQGKKPQVELEQFGPKVGQLNRSRQNQKAEGEKSKSKEFLAQAAKEPGAQTLPSGLVFKTVAPGNGPSPKATDRVKVHYHGTLIDGTVFDSSVKRGTPAEFGLNSVIPCWTEGVQKMHVGEKAKLVCPSTIAYGDMGRPPTIPGGATLIFDIELLGIEQAPPTAPGAPGAPGALPGATINLGGPHGSLPPGAMPAGHPGMPPGAMPAGHPGMPPGAMPAGHPGMPPAAAPPAAK